MRNLRTHGIEYDLRDLRIDYQIWSYYQQTNLGLNYRMSDIAASLGISQFKRLKFFIKKEIR